MKMNVLMVDIKEPDGLPLQAVQSPDTVFRHNPSCFEWQYVHPDNVEVPYSQSIEGFVQPIEPPLGYYWSASAGSLTDENTSTPTFSADGMTVPQTVSAVHLTLCPMEECNVCVTSRTLEVYRDHLERDYQNFGTGISCGDIVSSTTWKFSRYAHTVTMPHTWNCFGSVWHAYDGTHDGQATGIPSSGYSVSTYTHPIDWSTALSGLQRGDVVAFYHDDVLQHAHTCLGSSSQMYGANNQPGMKFIAIGSKVHMTGHWKWAVTTSREYYDKFNADYAAFFVNQSGPFLNKIRVYRKQ